MELPTEARELIESGALGHLVTLNADGSPQVSCVWVGIEDGQLVSGHLSARQQKLRNVRRDPRVTLSFEGEDPSARTEGVPGRPRYGPDRARRGA